MIIIGDPSVCCTTETVTGYKGVIVIDEKIIVEGDADVYAPSAQGSRDAVAVPPHVDVTVPVGEPLFPVGGVMADGKKGTKTGCLTGEALPDDLLDGSMHPHIRLFGKPKKGALVHMGEALEGAVADEEVVLYVPYHPFILALGPGTVGAAGPGDKPVVACEVEKASVEPDGIAHTVLDDGTFLIVHEDLGGHPAEVLKGSDHPLIGMLCIVAVGAEEVEPPGIAQGVDAEEDPLRPPCDDGDDLSPVALHLPARWCLEADRASRFSERASGLQIVPHDGVSSCVAPALDLPQDDDGVPDALAQKIVDDGLIGVQLALFRVGPYP